MNQSKTRPHCTSIAGAYVTPTMPNARRRIVKNSTVEEGAEEGVTPKR